MGVGNLRIASRSHDFSWYPSTQPPSLNQGAWYRCLRSSLPHERGVVGVVVVVVSVAAAAGERRRTRRRRRRGRRRRSSSSSSSRRSSSRRRRRRRSSSSLYYDDVVVVVVVVVVVCCCCCCCWRWCQATQNLWDTFLSQIGCKFCSKGRVLKAKALVSSKISLRSLFSGTGPSQLEITNDQG